MQRTKPKNFGEVIIAAELKNLGRAYWPRSDDND